MTEGFRRSGDQAYRPHCPSCNACQSIRVLVNEFILSKSQKRSKKRNASFVIEVSKQLKNSYYPLYEQYINTFHQDGSMFPANFSQFKSFLSSTLTSPIFIETWAQPEHDNNQYKDKQLICVAVTDVLTNALSAVYTFYHPDYKRSGLGVFSILTQIDLCKKQALPFLYLGYQIEHCKKMNYKNKYFPFEKFVDQEWLLVEKIASIVNKPV